MCSAATALISTAHGVHRADATCTTPQMSKAALGVGICIAGAVWLNPKQVSQQVFCSCTRVFVSPFCCTLITQQPPTSTPQPQIQSIRHKHLNEADYIVPYYIIVHMIIFAFKCANINVQQPCAWLPNGYAVTQS